MLLPFDIFVVIVEPIAICAILYLIMSKSGREIVPLGYRIGLGFAAIGFVSEVLWSMYVLKNGQYPDFFEIPFWLGKDVGYFVLTSTYVWRRAHGRRDILLPNIKPNERQNLRTK